MKDYVEVLRNYKPKRASKFIGLMMKIYARAYTFNKDVTYHYDFNINDYKNKQICLIANHSSYDVFYYVVDGFYTGRFNAVVGYSNFFNKKIFNMLISSGAIPKYNYVSDFSAVKNILRLVKDNASILLFPEGVQSTIGSTHPMNPATLKLFKKMNIDVISCHVDGAYLTRPRFYNKEFNKGPIDVTYKVLFTKEELDKLSIDEMYERYLKELTYNDFLWNKSKQYSYINKNGLIKGFDALLYKCPICKEEGSIETTNDSIRCNKCNLIINVDDKYNLYPNKELSFDRLDKWYLYQRHEIKKEIESSDINYEFKVDYYELDKYHLHKIKTKKDNSIKVGNGKLILTKDNLKYIGTYKENNVEYIYDYKLIPSTLLIPNQGLELIYNDNYNEFLFTESPKLIVKVMLLIEELHNIYNKEWNKNSIDVYK